MEFSVKAIEQVTLTGPEELRRSALMSPFVWRIGGKLALLVRAVPPVMKAPAITGRIWYAVGAPDGLHFSADATPLLSPGPGDLDIRGCEDPTVVPARDACIVYYTGLDHNGRGQ